MRIHRVKIVNFIRHSFAIFFTLDTTNTVYVYILIRCEKAPGGREKNLNKKKILFIEGVQMHKKW